MLVEIILIVMWLGGNVYIFIKDLNIIIIDLIWKLVRWN